VELAITAFDRRVGVGQTGRLGGPRNPRRKRYGIQPLTLLTKSLFQSCGGKVLQPPYCFNLACAYGRGQVVLTMTKRANHGNHRAQPGHP
jgi:hypothetical protein